MAVVTLVSASYAQAATPAPVPKPKTVFACLYTVDERTPDDRDAFVASGNFIINLPKDRNSVSWVEYTTGYLMQLSYLPDGWLMASIYKRPGYRLGYMTTLNTPMQTVLRYDSAAQSPTGAPFMASLSCWPELR